MTGYKSLKSADEVDPEDFVHVILTRLVHDKKKKLVVKIHEAGSMFASREIKAMKKFDGYRNTVQLVCDFVCQDDKARWQWPISKKTSFCNGSNGNGSSLLHFIAMEYIHDGDLGEFLSRTRDCQVLASFFLQTTRVIIELGSIYKIAHGDINSGNIMVTTTKKARLAYNCMGNIVHVDPCGYIPVFLDYGRSTDYEDNTKNKRDILQDVLMAFHVYSNWMASQKLKTNVRSFIQNEMNHNKRDLDKLVMHIKTMFEDP